MFTTHYLYLFTFPPGLGFIYLLYIFNLPCRCTLNKLETIDDTVLITFCSDIGDTFNLNFKKHWFKKLLIEETLLINIGLN